MTQVIVFGETLFDCFPDSNPILGGAPLNVAWHLSGFQLSPRFISSVGNDKLGHQAKSALHNWGLNIEDIQTHDQAPTGCVDITLKNGEPNYTIQDKVAYDFITTPNISLDTNTLVYHGSLALRHPHNQKTLRGLLHSSTCKRFIDVNLRAPWWQKAPVLKNVTNAAFVKMNAGEFEELFGLTTNIKNAEYFRQTHNIETLVITCGDQPSIFVNHTGEKFLIDAEHATTIVDTVGAGDAFTAICILGELYNWPWPLRIERAHHFANTIIQQTGAITDNTPIYAQVMEKWKISS